MHLAVKNPWGKTKEEFYLGDPFVFKLKGDRTIYRGNLTTLDVENGTLLIKTAIIKLEDVAVVYSQKKRSNRFSSKLITAGVMLPIIDHFNNSVIMDNEFSWNRGVMVASGVLVSSGLAIRYLRRKKYRTHGRFRLMFKL
ncbi:MAG: hypothetical protein AAF944_07565 [Bacteroidota bacterium]